MEINKTENNTENCDEAFKTKEQQKIDNKNLDAKLIVAKIIKNLRETKSHLLFSVFQDVNSAKINNSTLYITFLGENYKEILENLDNINKINDIIKQDNLKINFSFETEKSQKPVEEILKEKFTNIEIKE